jgi:hypothetical protein
VEHSFKQHHKISLQVKVYIQCISEVNENIALVYDLSDLFDTIFVCPVIKILLKVKVYYVHDNVPQKKNFFSFSCTGKDDSAIRPVRCTYDIYLAASKHVCWQ